MKVVPASISDIEVDKFRNDGSLLVSWGSALINTDGLRNEIIAGAPLTPGANKDAKGNSQFHGQHFDRMKMLPAQRYNELSGAFVKMRYWHFVFGCSICYNVKSYF